jgi:hypothetical protein
MEATRFSSFALAPAAGATTIVRIAVCKHQSPPHLIQACLAVAGLLSRISYKNEAPVPNCNLAYCITIKIQTFQNPFLIGHQQNFFSSWLFAADECDGHAIKKALTACQLATD